VGQEASAQGWEERVEIWSENVKGPFWGTSHNWEDNIKVGLPGVVRKGSECIYLEKLGVQGEGAPPLV